MAQLAARYGVGLRPSRVLAIAAVFLLIALPFIFVFPRLQVRAEAALVLKVQQEHAATCDKLGRPPGTAEHSSCLTELQRLKGFHEQLFASAVEGIL